MWRAAFLFAVALLLAPNGARGALTGPPSGAASPLPTASPLTQPTAFPRATALPEGTSPFATPTPSPSPGPIGNGFIVAGYNSGSGSGGIIPLPVASGTPAPFPSSNGTGFFFQIAGRLSTYFSAMLRFDDYGLHGGDKPVVSRADGAVYYQPGGHTLALGIGYGSLQRSSNTVSASAFGLGASLLPDFRRNASPYADLFYYPSAQTLGASASIFTAQAGVMLRAPRSGLLAKLGFDFQSYPNPNTSPTSLSGVQLGLGASF